MPFVVAKGEKQVPTKGFTKLVFGREDIYKNDDRTRVYWVYNGPKTDPTSVIYKRLEDELPQLYEYVKATRGRDFVIDPPGENWGKFYNGEWHRSGTEYDPVEINFNTNEKLAMLLKEIKKDLVPGLFIPSAGTKNSYFNNYRSVIRLEPGITDVPYFPKTFAETFLRRYGEFNRNALNTGDFQTDAKQDRVKIDDYITKYFEKLKFTDSELGRQGVQLAIKFELPKWPSVAQMVKVRTRKAETARRLQELPMFKKMYAKHVLKNDPQFVFSNNSEWTKVFGKTQRNTSAQPANKKRTARN